MRIIDAAPAVTADDVGVASYAVLWQKGDGPRMSGRLEFGPLGLRLYGDHDTPVGVEISFEKIVSVERGPGVRIGPCRAIRLTSRSAGSFLLASIAGAGTLSEILWRVLDALPAPALEADRRERRTPDRAFPQQPSPGP